MSNITNIIWRGDIQVSYLKTNLFLHVKLKILCIYIIFWLIYPQHSYRVHLEPHCKNAFMNNGYLFFLPSKNWTISSLEQPKGRPRSLTIPMSSDTLGIPSKPFSLWRIAFKAHSMSWRSVENTKKKWCYFNKQYL